MLILLLNAGSSSLKATLFESEGARVLARCTADWAGATTQYRYATDGPEATEPVAWRGHGAAVRRFVADIEAGGPDALVPNRTAIAAVGHRVVHGGDFHAAVKVDCAVRARIAELVEIAPLHNPPSLETIDAAVLEFPETPQVAVFDTAFHATMLPEAYTCAVPEQWRREWGIRRYGFHGLSHAYCSRRAAEMLGRPATELKILVCHLGHGCSAAAIDGGRSVDTTMGFTPLDGLMMATRCGSLDPGIVLHVQQRHGQSAGELETTLNRRSGLLGVSGVSADMREVLAAAQAGNEQAQLALAVYTRRVRQAIGSLAVTLGRVDALVFTAGVGEHAAEVRRMICENLACLGLELDPRANAAAKPDADIATKASPGRILIVTTREDLTMLDEVVAVLDGSSRPASA